MTTFFQNIFRWSETTADKIIKIKEKWLGTFADIIIPLPVTRQRFKDLFKKLLRPVSQPLSDKIDQLIESDFFTVANLFSLSRALSGPLFYIFAIHEFGLPYYLMLLAWAAFSDYFDGIIARKMNQQTELGAALDAGCDKIFAIGAALSFWQQLWLLPKILFLVFDGTLAILALSLHLAKAKGNYHGQAQIKANWLGKLKFNFQGLALILVLANLPVAANYSLLLANILALGSLLRHLSPKN